MKTDRVETPESKEAMILRVGELIRKSRIFAMGFIDDEQHLIVTSMGINPANIPDVLRHFAQHVERESEVEKVRQAIAAVPDTHKGICPSCSSEVVVATPIPDEALAGQRGKRALCVCTCGAFMAAGLLDGSLSLRMLTQEEIATLPDEIRNAMLRVRRDFERMHAEHQQGN